jgi:4-hydroxythreonine-4-phosphate dehydrogenase
LGDPEGIGPEIVAKSLDGHSSNATIIVIGNRNDYPVKDLTLISNIHEILQPGIYFFDVPPGSFTGDASYKYIEIAIDWALKKFIHAIVTAPISKEKWLNAGISYKGHTDLLAETAGVGEHCMFFWSSDLKVALFTVHIPLKEVFQHIKKEKIEHFIRFVHRELKRLNGKSYKILVSGLNPHAGESGYIGSEEVNEIIPAIDSLKPEMDIEGPFPPDIIFIKARETEDSAVISWYHDQGLIAFKLLNIHSGVNMTLGLPYIRTSPDHGTAYDISGKGIANPNSMKEAIILAEESLNS